MSQHYVQHIIVESGVVCIGKKRESKQPAVSISSPDVATTNAETLPYTDDDTYKFKDYFDRGLFPTHYRNKIRKNM